MGIFSRIFKVGEAHANRAIDRLEKPEVMLEQAIRDQNKAIQVAKEKIQAVIATERQSKAQLDKEKHEKMQWEERANFALKENNESLATKALMRAETHQKNIASLTPNWQLQNDSIGHLKIELQKMQDDLNELKRNKDIIIAQSKSAEVKKSIYEARAAIGKNNTTDLIARMKTKADRQSYEAEAAKELASSLDGKDALEKEFENLGQQDVSFSVKKKLEEMKNKLNP